MKRIMMIITFCFIAADVSAEGIRTRLNPTDGSGAILLQPCPDTWLQAYPVSTYVNSPRNNDSKCIERVGTEVNLLE